jgi:uncharacterized protein YoxC
MERMIIVWISLALVVVMIGWFVIRGVRELRALKRSFVHLAKSAEILRENGEAVAKQGGRLRGHVSVLAEDAKKKSAAVRRIMDEAGALTMTIEKTKGAFVTAIRERMNQTKI